jgi:hypothetical protein
MVHNALMLSSTQQNAPLIFHKKLSTNFSNHRYAFSVLPYLMPR